MRSQWLLLLFAFLLVGCISQNSTAGVTPTPPGYHLTFDTHGIAILASSYTGSLVNTASGTTEQMHLDHIQEKTQFAGFTATLTIVGEFNAIPIQGDISPYIQGHFQDTYSITFGGSFFGAPNSFPGQINVQDGSLSGEANLEGSQNTGSWTLHPEAV